MTDLCRLFRSDGWWYCGWHIPSNIIRVARLDDLCRPYIIIDAASERTFSMMGNDIGKVVSVILSQWLNVS